ncbi:DUF1631 domain-containing protein [Pseudomonadales bacterium]|nr:DUF1631 domain-containing protein [Pseudomonadales bacterium]
MANQTESNIISLNALSNAARESSTTDASSRLDRSASYQAKIHRHMTAPLIQLQEKSQQNLMKLLENMFDKVDDALFELAEKSVNNSEQNIFFESMREVRLKRIDIEAQYADSFGNSFVDLFHPVAVDNKESLSAASDVGLSLMADEAVEEMVAMDAMVAKAEKHLSAPLSALYARIGSLAPVEVDRVNNPLGPKRLCDQFSDACLQLTIDIKARLVVFKLYDKYVVGELAKLYAQANEQLIANNILPDFRLTQRRSERSANIVEKANSVSERLLQGALSNSPANDLSNDPANGLSANPQDIYQLLQQLNHLDFTGASDASARSSTAASTHPLAGALNLLPVSAKPAIGHELLLQLLTTLQQDPTRIAGYSEASSAGDLSVLMPKQLTQGLSQSLSAIADGGDHSIGQGERDVISFVSLLFQFVLDDRSLAEPMKAAISRLQIPIIKVAMQDAGFFSEQAHPARRLLNEMTTAALGWIAEDNYQNDSLYQCVCATIERVSNEFVDDTQLFSDVLADFISFVDYEKKRADLREKRVVDAEAGRDRSESARAYVSRLIESKNLEHTAPEFVRAMIENSWNNMLFLTYLKKGVDSQEWLDAVAAMDDLLWTVAPERFVGDRAGIIARIPGMLKFLRQGLNSINFDSYAAGEFFAHLEHFHLDVMQRPESMAYYKVPSNAVPVCSMIDAVDDEEVNLRIAEESDDPYIAKAKMLGVGQWVEFIDAAEDGGETKKMRCRLAAILRNSGKRIFASRSGVKAGEYTVRDIADRLANESLLLLEDAQLFDKALSSIIDDLRQSRSAVNA